MDLLAKQFLFYLLSMLRVQCHRGLGKPVLFSIYHEELAFYSFPAHNVGTERESLLSKSVLKQCPRMTLTGTAVPYEISPYIF